MAMSFFGIRVHPVDLEQIREEAETAGVSLAAYARHCLITGLRVMRATRRAPDLDETLRRELGLPPSLPQPRKARAA